MTLKAICEESIIGYLIKNPLEEAIRQKIVQIKNITFPLTTEDFIFYNLPNQDSQIRFYNDIIKLLASLNTLNTKAHRGAIAINNRKIPIETIQFSKDLAQHTYYFILRINELYKKCTHPSERDNLSVLLNSVLQLIDKSKQVQAKFLFLKKETNVRFFVSSNDKKLYRKKCLENIDQEHKDILEAIELIKGNAYLKNHPDPSRYVNWVISILLTSLLGMTPIGITLFALSAPVALGVSYNIFLTSLLGMIPTSATVFVLSPPLGIAYMALGIGLIVVGIALSVICMHWLNNTNFVTIHSGLESITAYCKQQSELVCKKIKEVDYNEEKTLDPSNQLSFPNS